MAHVETERRRAPRHPADIPIRLAVGGRTLSARTINVSRIGVLVRLPIAELGIEPTADEPTVMERVTASLGDLVVADFDPAQLGSLVHKGLRPVRIALPSAGSDAVEVGCALREQLTEEEMRALDLPTDDVVLEPVPLNGAVTPPVIRRGVDALILAADGRGAPPLAAHLEGGTPGQIEVVVPPEAREGRLPERPTVRGVLDAIRHLYGGQPALVLSRGGRPVWSGAARVRAARVNRARDRVTVTLSYLEEPSEGVWARLGLESVRHTVPDALGPRPPL